MISPGVLKMVVKKKKKSSAAQVAGRKKAKWKLERRKKYLKGADKSKKPAAGTRSRVWVPAYKRADGTKVAGHYRANHHAHKKGVYAKSGVGSKKHQKLRKAGKNPRAKKR